MKITPEERLGLIVCLILSLELWYLIYAGV